MRIRGAVGAQALCWATGAWDRVPRVRWSSTLPDRPGRLSGSLWRPGSLIVDTAVSERTRFVAYSVVIVLIAGCTMMYGLGRGTLRYDEALYASVVDRVSEHGDWLHLKSFEGESADPMAGMFENLYALEDRIAGIFSERRVETIRTLYTQ